MEDLNIKQMMLAAKTIAAEKNLPEEKVLEVIEDKGVTEDEFDIIVKSIKNEFKRLNGNGNKNVEFKIKFKKASFERFKEVLEKICDSKGVL